MNRPTQRLTTILAMALGISPIASFPIRPITRSFYSCRSVVCPTSTSLKQGNILDGGGDDDDGVNFTDFNPLKYQTSGSSKTKSVYDYAGTQISLRQTTMSEMTNKLLNSVGDAETTNSILEEYQDFLLEPLEDQDAVLETGSIYSSGMSRQDRYAAYRNSMNARVASCKNGNVRQVLTSMRDYVLSHENDE